MKDTFIPSKNFILKKWFLIDAKNQKLGRLASEISKILTGKKKPIYTPFLMYENLSKYLKNRKQFKKPHMP